jgi:hypothetical protein
LPALSYVRLNHLASGFMRLWAVMRSMIVN